MVIKPHKKEIFRTRLTVGGNLLPYEHDKSTPTAEIPTIKTFLNSVISTPHARFITLDIANFYLNPDLPEPEYMRLDRSIIPNDIIEYYNLHPLFHNNDIYIQIDKGMYGLKQAGLLAWKDLKQHLSLFNVFPVKHTPGLWKHSTRPIMFILVVDDFGVKYQNKEDLDYLTQALKPKYTITITKS